MTKPPRRFPPPWEVHEATESFCIHDSKGQARPGLDQARRLSDPEASARPQRPPGRSPGTGTRGTPVPPPRRAWDSGIGTSTQHAPLHLRPHADPEGCPTQGRLTLPVVLAASAPKLLHET
jgi:hypothetical protein